MIGTGILRNTAVTTQGADAKTIVIVADNMTEDDSRMIAGSSWMGAAELAGFDLLLCRDRSGNEWSRRLYPK